jgi:hypothetical protein
MWFNEHTKKEGLMFLLFQTYITIVLRILEALFRGRIEALFRGRLEASSVEK